MGRLGTRTQQAWGLLGAAFAALFAVWMLFFPDFVPTHFAWNVQPRFAQVVIGAGYVFRTAFFLNVAFEKDWLRLRWIVWGNLVFTGVLLFATYWHAPEFLWDPFTSPVAHIWIVLYIFEPVRHDLSPAAGHPPRTRAGRPADPSCSRSDGSWCWSPACS